MDLLVIEKQRQELGFSLDKRYNDFSGLVFFYTLQISFKHILRVVFKPALLYDSISDTGFA